MAEDVPSTSRPDPALSEARLNALSGEIIRSYRAGLAPKEIAEIYVLDLAGVVEVLRASNAHPPAKRWWLRPVSFRRDRRRPGGGSAADSDIA